MADYSAYLIAVGDTDYPAKITGLNEAVEADVTALQGEVTTARGGALSLDDRLDGMDATLLPYAGATGDLDMGAHRIAAAAALSPGQLTTLSQVLGLITGGASPGDIPVTDLNPGTATAGQALAISDDGTAIVGRDEFRAGTYFFAQI